MKTNELIDIKHQLRIFKNRLMASGLGTVILPTHYTFRWAATTKKRAHITNLGDHHLGWVPQVNS